MSDDELDAAIAGLEQAENDISLRRRMLHGRIDLLRPVLVARLEELVTAGGQAPVDPTSVAEGRKLFDGTGEQDALVDDLGPIPDAESLTTDELRAAIRRLEQVEDDVSLERRMLQGKLDILRAERERRRRGDPSIGPEDLGAILGGGS